MTEVVSIKFKSEGRSYFFDPAGLKPELDELVVVETSRGIECGYVCETVKKVRDEQIVKPLKKVLRIATDADKKKLAENKKKANDAFSVCEKKVIEHKLDMHLVNTEYTFDGSKILFYFTSDGRVDFRELVKDLAAVFKTRIELRQIGVRDESKTLGSIGICGRNLCCSQFLGEFVPVSIKMAKEQGLSLNPTKISGACGRLMCCLKYEQDTYEALNRETPSSGTVVMTPEGKGEVVSVALLKGVVRVRLESDDETTQKDFAVNEVEIFSPSAEKQQDFVTDEELFSESTDDEPAKKDKKPARSRNRRRSLRHKQTTKKDEE